MTTMTYLQRRSGGMFYVQIRVTRYSGRRHLLRFSLGTRDKHEARQRLLAYLTWLLPMQSAAEPTILFHTILSVARALILKGPAKTEADVNYRAHFMRTGWAHREDWRLSNPCPIRDSASYACHDEVRVTLVMLNEMLREDMKRLNLSHADESFLLRPAETIEALCFDRQTGAVRAYLPKEFADVYEELPASDFGVRDAEVSLFDVYNDPRGGQPAHCAPTIVAEAPAVPPLESPGLSLAARAPAAGHAAQASGMTIKQARNKYLEIRRTQHGDGRADEDTGLILDFLIDLIGDKRLDAITSDDLLDFETAMAQTPDRKGIARKKGFGGLKMISEKRITNVWHRCLACLVMRPRLLEVTMVRRKSQRGKPSLPR